MGLLYFALAVLILGVGFATLYCRPASKNHQLYFLIALVLTTLMGELALIHFGWVRESVFAWRLSLTSVLLVQFLLIALIKPSSPGLDENNRVGSLLGMAASILVVWYSSYTPSVIKEMTALEDHPVIAPGSHYFPFIALFLSLAGFLIVVAAYRYTHRRRGHYGNQAIYLVVLATVFWLCEIIFLFWLPLRDDFHSTFQFLPAVSVLTVAVGSLVLMGNWLWDWRLLVAPLLRTQTSDEFKRLRQMMNGLFATTSFEGIVAAMRTTFRCDITLEVFGEGGESQQYGSLLSLPKPETATLGRLHGIFSEELARNRYFLATRYGGSNEGVVKKLTDLKADLVLSVCDGEQVLALVRFGWGASRLLYSRQHLSLLEFLVQQLVVAIKIIMAQRVSLAAQERKIIELTDHLATLQEGSQRWLSLASGRKREPDQADFCDSLMAMKTLEDSDYPLVGRDPEFVKNVAMARRVAPYDVPVLIFGETGTGKENIARFIHQGSRRRGRLIDVNLAAIPESLFEAELFGAVRGAYTGLTHPREGLIVAAEGGTLFLDEIAELPLVSQVKLLRVIQHKEVRPVGATQSRKVDVRFVAASNSNLEAMVAAGKFRRDLMMRLDVVHLRMPSLAERLDDIPELATHFLARANQRFGKHCRLSHAMQGLLMTRAWPGNIRDLSNFMERLVLLGEAYAVFAPELSEQEKTGLRQVLKFPLDFSLAIQEHQRELLESAILCSKSTQEAAAFLHLSPQNFCNYCKKFDIDRKQFQWVRLENEQPVLAPFVAANTRVLGVA